jgi:hypothetical protein
VCAAVYSVNENTRVLSSARLAQLRDAPRGFSERPKKKRPFASSDQSTRPERSELRLQETETAQVLKGFPSRRASLRVTRGTARARARAGAQAHGNGR